MSNVTGKIIALGGGGGASEAEVEELRSAIANIQEDMPGYAAEATEAWLEENISNPDSPPLDRTLAYSSAAAPADMVGSIRNEIASKAATLTSNAQNVDLDITDDDGNVLARFSEGEVKTKKFDSSSVNVTKATKNVDSDLDITDQYGNVLARFSNGGFSTSKYSLEKMNGVSEEHTDYIDYHLNNRLANPIYETHEHYNEEHPSAQIEAETALIKGAVTSDMNSYRIPSVCITNSGTFLVSAQRMVNTSGDTGDLSIDVSRKATGGNWAASVVVPFDSTRESYGNPYNDEFLVDRNTGRIYLFFGTIMEKVEWIAADGEDCDLRYVYSDNDGQTWSSTVSLKSLWDTDTYDYCIPACTKGIVLTNGTLVVPCMAKRGTSYSTGQSYSLLLIKPPSGNWYLSSVAHVDGLKISDECAVVEGLNENEIWLYSRPQTNYGTGVNRGYNKYIYDITTDTFVHQRSTFDGNRKNGFGIDKITIDNKAIYLMTFTDTNGDVRENTTLWASLDGDTWIRVYRINKPSSNGYSVIDNHNGTIAVAYEASSDNGGCIKFQDISDLSQLIYDSATKYIEKNISVQDRLQMIFNSAKGLD